MRLRPTKAAQCRRNAYYCQMLAADAASEADRSSLMTMRRAWLALANNEDWLAGASGILNAKARQRIDPAALAATSGP